MLQHDCPSVSEASNSSTSATTNSSSSSSPTPTPTPSSIHPLLPSPSLADIRTSRESTRPSAAPLPLFPVNQFNRGYRKPIPSPPQSSPHFTSTSNPRARSPRSPPLSPSPYYNEPRSPREKLDALLAEEDVEHPSNPAAPTQVDIPRVAHHSGKLSSYAQLRNVSAPILSSAGISPPLSPAAMPPPPRPNKPETRPTVQRNASIDSAVSSLSSNASQSYRPNQSHAYKPSQDGASPTSLPDIASLIVAAGSPEAALLAMWKEKQNASNHNAQLWRLVDKQRSMILGLNKDLERALKDKDRYRKKLKEYANHVPPIPGFPKTSDTFDSVVERDLSQSPAPSEQQEDSTRPLTTPTPKMAEHKTSPLVQEHTVGQMFPDSHLVQSPTNSEAPIASNPTSSVTSPTDYSVKPLNLAGKGLGLNGIVSENMPTAEPQVEPQVELISAETSLPKISTTPPASPGTHLKAPALSLTQATPVLGGDGFEAPPGKPVHPLRKAPPAPLNLSKPAKTSAHLHQTAPGENDDSDYNDTLEVDEIPIVERGRRKTREEDDRIREGLYTQESARSKSKKKKNESKSKSKAGTGEVSGTDENASVAGSLSPRQFSPLQAGLPLSPRHPPANSLNALLSPANSDSSIIAQRSVGSSPLMSPGLPTSPRPGDRPLGSPLPRFPKQNLASPPMSPRSGVPQPTPRAPRQPIPLPPNTPQSYTSPQVVREPPAQAKYQTPSLDLLKAPNAQHSPDSDGSLSLNDSPAPEHVYRGLVSDQYPGLLLPPNALPSIDVKVSSSRLRPSRMSYLAPKPQEEDPVFILAISARSDGKQLWRMEKTIVALPTLDAQIKSLSDFNAELPNRALFSGHAPAKMDARRAALNQYFDTILETPMSENAALIVCEFFSTDVIGAQGKDTLAPETSAVPASAAPKGRQRKEGYLTKRGKNFGGWKARFFILDGPEFRYYESVGGAHLGTIKLLNAQIGKQSQQQSNQSPQRRDDSEDNQYRHAFLILEPKRRDSSSLVRHVLCAESDDERDAWVDALLQHVDWQDESPVEVQASESARSVPIAKVQGQDTSRTRRNDSPDIDEKRDRIQALSYDDTVAAEAPVRGPTHREAKESQAQSPKVSSFQGDNNGHYLAISAPTNGAPIQNAEFWGNRNTAAPTAAPTAVKDKKRSIFGFRGRAPSELQFGGPQQQSLERIVQVRNVFGIPLQEAVEYSQPVGVGVALPAVVYRCLEYLKAKKASSEEGIFRLSGSNILIKGLRERFNNEGDVKLLEGQYYDVHAVASLLKLYLRELPASILTRDLHLDFLKVLDMDERTKKIQTFNVLVHKLPMVNLELLRAISSYLIDIINNSHINKMTVRNVGIVFAPTLNIPAPLISMFLTDFPDIFGTALDEAASPIHEIQISTPPLGNEAVRSPRRQMFSDLPTPAYNATSFQRLEAPSSFPLGQGGHQQQQQHQQSSQHPQYAGYDTGFIPLRPSYDTPAYEPGYGSLNGTVASGSAKDIKQRRRESGMHLMNMGQPPRKGPNTRIREANSYDPRMDPRVDPRLVRDEIAFD